MLQKFDCDDSKQYYKNYDCKANLSHDGSYISNIYPLFHVIIEQILSLRRVYIKDNTNERDFEATYIIELKKNLMCEFALKLEIRKCYIQSPWPGLLCNRSLNRLFEAVFIYCDALHLFCYNLWQTFSFPGIRASESHLSMHFYSMMFRFENLRPVLVLIR